jgi:Flp pilus assembly protein TadB
MRLRFNEIAAADVDWKVWVLPIILAVVLLGVLVEVTGHNPVVAVGVVVLVAIVVPIRRRQLRRRLEQLERQKHKEAGGSQGLS